MIVMEVQTGLSHCDHPRVAKQLAKPSLGLGVPFPRIVRVQPRSGRQAGLRGRHGERCLRTRPGFADHHHPGDPRGPSPLEHLGPVGRECRVGEMAVGVD